MNMGYKDKIKAVRGRLFYALILLAPFSLVPSIALPTLGFDSFRIGTYQLLALVFIVLCVGQFVRDYIKKPLTRDDRLVYGIVILLSGIAAYNLTDALEPARSLLMAVSFVFLLVVMLMARWYVGVHGFSLESMRPVVLKTAIAYGVISLGQLLIATVSDVDALLCTGCGSGVFGFPRINGFAAEPLFWANALLPIWLYSLHVYRTSRDSLARLAYIATTLSIALTFSRGAYLAVAVMTVLYFVLTGKKSARRVAGIGVATGVAAMMLLVGSASIRYRDTPGIVRETASGIAEHLSFGRINFAENKPAPTEPIPPNSNDTSFDSQGYVEASTNDRTSSARLAIEAWYRPANLILGVGLGNLGPYVAANIQADAPSNLTVYIYYILILAELGILGLTLLLTLYGSALRRLAREQGDEARLILIILVGFLVHYWFFGSSINVVYIWLWLGIGLGYHKSNAKNKQKVFATVSKV